MRGACSRALLAVLLAAVLPACKSTLRGGLSEQEADQIALALAAANIAATKTKAKGTSAQARFEVQVAGSEVARALRMLEREKLPRPPHTGFAELFADTGIVATPAEERARWVTATAGELSRSLERFPGVIDARVHLALPEAQRALDAPAAPAKASVLIRRKANAPILAQGEVEALVAGAVDGLSPDQVTVVQVASATDPAPSAGLVHVGPISVTRASAATLKAVLGTALAVDVSLAIALVVLWRGRRRGPSGTA